MKNIFKRYILIVCGVFLASLVTHAAAVIKGTVADSKGVVLPGVVVSEKGNNNKAFTDIDGKFSIEVAELPTTLIFKKADFKRLLQVIDKTTDDVEIKLVKEDMEYVAYGKKAKHSITSSIFSISGEELLRSRSTNLMIALQGRLPGLTIIQKDGEPGKETFNTQIRGFDSPNSNGVMFVVDGVERSAAGIDIYEIERVTVLKDAAATAIYGMRGAGGVLLINTKSGFVGKSKISVSLDHSMQAPTRLPSFVSAYDYAHLYNQRLENDFLYNGSGGEPYTEREIERYMLADSTGFYPVRDMADEFMKDYAKQTRVNVNFQGGSKQMRYFTSLGYSQQGSIFEHEPFDKYSYDAESKSTLFNFRTNLDITLNPQLDVWLNIGGSMGKMNAPYAGGLGWNSLIEKLYKTPNNAYQDLTPDGEVIIKKDKLTFRNNNSIYGDLYRTGSTLGTNLRLNNTFGARQKLESIIPGLSATAQLAFDVNSNNSQIRKRTYEGYEVQTLLDVNGLDSLGYVKNVGTKNSTLSDSRTNYFYYMYNMRASLDYDQTFGQKHHVTAMLMAQRQMQQKEIYLPTNYMGLAGRMSYAYNNRYFMDASFAYQGSEQFAKSNRFGFFPSFALGWVVSNEGFLENNSTVTFLKLRASAGQVGNNAYAYGKDNQYLYLTSWNSNSTENQLGNENIQWETSTKYNVGIETELFNSLYVGADFFYHDNSDLIIKDIAILPDGMMGLGGASLPPANLGESINKGFELVIGYNKEINEDFFVNLNGNVSYNQNEKTFTAEMPYDQTYAYAYRSQGYAGGYHWGYKTDGLFSSDEEIEGWADQTALGGSPIPGDIKYMDLTGDGVVDEKDKAPLGIGQTPEITYGAQLAVNYKWFDLTAFVHGTANRNIYMSGLGVSSNQDNFTEVMKKSWTAEKFAAGEDISYPRLGKESSNYIKSDYWMVNASYVRLRNIELGFTLPDKLCNLIKASSIRIYANGLNLLTWDHLSSDYFDPESGNASLTNYPIQKAYNFGINLKF
ncbi:MULTISPECIES: SusC/RagA family TonB-linked outer membrane protein [unclassified Saccharicrinis]|uniref:SusC/RagA family TonB-linked outer membrane protein n=1 Tax=unclassified Saccharicrinis TaxID=2646859 RepID=UPI003D326142